MMGQANVFFRYLPEKIPLAIDRYQAEVPPPFGVLERSPGKARIPCGRLFHCRYCELVMGVYPWLVGCPAGRFQPPATVARADPRPAGRGTWPAAPAVEDEARRRQRDEPEGWDEFVAGARAIPGPAVPAKEFEHARYRRLPLRSDQLRKLRWARAGCLRATAPTARSSPRRRSGSGPSCDARRSRCTGRSRSTRRSARPASDASRCSARSARRGSIRTRQTVSAVPEPAAGRRASARAVAPGGPTLASLSAAVDVAAERNPDLRTAGDSCVRAGFDTARPIDSALDSARSNQVRRAGRTGPSWRAPAGGRACEEAERAARQAAGVVPVQRRNALVNALESA